EDGAGREAVARGLRAFHGLEHRIEPAGTVHGRRFFNDSKATNVDSMRQALLSFGHPLTVLAGGRDKHGDFPGLARLAEERIDHLELFGDAAPVIAAARPRIAQEGALTPTDAGRRPDRLPPQGG